MNAIARYRNAQVRQAVGVELVQLLFAEAAKRLHQARTLKPGDSTRIAHLHHVRSIYLELLQGLDGEAAPDFVAQVAPLYRWCIDRTVAAGVGEGADTALHQVARVTDTLTDAWYQIGSAEARSA
jgi:flagellar biosynthetic protein FliS